MASSSAPRFWSNANLLVLGAIGGVFLAGAFLRTQRPASTGAAIRRDLDAAASDASAAVSSAADAGAAAVSGAAGAVQKSSADAARAVKKTY
jgi:hypothetical protein